MDKRIQIRLRGPGHLNAIVSSHDTFDDAIEYLKIAKKNLGGDNDNNDVPATSANEPAKQD